MAYSFDTFSPQSLRIGGFFYIDPWGNFLQNSREEGWSLGAKWMKTLLHRSNSMTPSNSCAS